MNINKIAEYQRQGILDCVAIAEHYKDQGADVIVKELHNELAYRGYTQLPIFTESKGRKIVKFSVDRVMDMVRETDLTLIQYILVKKYGFSGSRIREVDQMIQETCDKIVNKEQGWQELLDDIEKETGIRIGNMIEGEK